MTSILFLCKQDATSEEIISFLYKAILCEYHAACFCLARTEFKNNSILKKFIYLFNIYIITNIY